MLDTSTGDLAFANAGHNPPIVVRASGEAEMLEGGGPVLGILPIAPYSEMRTQLDRGDMLVLYSDGVTEANNLNYDEYDEERFIEVLKQHRRAGRRDRGSSDEIARRIRRRRAAGRRYHAGGGEDRLVSVGQACLRLTSVRLRAARYAPHSSGQAKWLKRGPSP